MKITSHNNQCVIEKHQQDLNFCYEMKYITIYNYVFINLIDYLVITVDSDIIWKVPFWLVLENSNVKHDYDNNHHIFINENFLIESKNVFPLKQNCIWKLESKKIIIFSIEINVIKIELPFEKKINQFEEIVINNENTKLRSKNLVSGIYLNTSSKELKQIKISLDNNDFICYNKSILKISDMEKKINLLRFNYNAIFDLFENIFPNEIIEMIVNNLVENNYYYNINFGMKNDNNYAINFGKFNNIIIKTNLIDYNNVNLCLKVKNIIVI